MHDLTAFERDVLYVLGGLDRPHGTRIKAEIEAYYGAPATPGRLYPALDRLADLGLVAKSRRNGRTNAYALTRRGERELQDRRTWERRLLAGGAVRGGNRRTTG